MKVFESNILEALKLEESNPSRIIFKFIESSSVVSFSSSSSGYLPLEVIPKPPANSQIRL